MNPQDIVQKLWTLCQDGVELFELHMRLLIDLGSKGVSSGHAAR